MESSAETGQVPPLWNFHQLSAALVIGFVLQSIFLPCLCSIGTAKMTLAWCIDALVLARMLIAYFRHERGRGWVFYTVLCYTSFAWIEAGAYLILGET